MFQWFPGEDICFRFDDKTAEQRSEAELQALTDELREVANKYDFDLSAHGTWKSFKKVALGELMLVAKDKIYNLLDEEDEQ